MKMEMQVDEAKGIGAHGEKPALAITHWAQGIPTAYACSECGQMFLPPEDRSPQEGTVELQAAFAEHVSEEH
jgi:hypothetical protein